MEMKKVVDIGFFLLSKEWSSKAKMSKLLSACQLETFVVVRNYISIDGPNLFRIYTHLSFFFQEPVPLEDRMLISPKEI